MAHQPFETWIFSEKTLSSQQREQLAAHLTGCSRCQRMEHAWQSISRQMESTKSVSPTRGFTARWRANFNTRLEKHQNELAKRWFIGLSAAAVLSITLLFIENLATDANSMYLGNISYWFTEISALFSQLRNVVLLLLNNAPTYIWVIAGIVAASWIGIMVFTGSIIVLRYRHKGTTHENNY
jgi:anti-sigma factor RsiW